jgi:hypothetical protein
MGRTNNQTDGNSNPDLDRGAGLLVVAVVIADSGVVAGLNDSLLSLIAVEESRSLLEGKATGLDEEEVNVAELEREPDDVDELCRIQSISDP